MIIRQVGKAALVLLPKRLLTLWVGRLCKTRASRLVIPLFALFYGIALEECELPYKEYRSLTDFFSRRLKPSLRRLAAKDHVVVSPVDGVVSSCGSICKGLLVQVKGVQFSVDDLLCEDTLHYYDEGYFAIIYLSPRDYHRIHAPLQGILTRILRIKGTLFPVNQIGIRAIEGLYAKNERVVFSLSQQGKNFALVAVGSTLVGSVQLAPTLCNTPPITINQGDEVGWFEFGSTVILLFAKSHVQLSLSPGQRLKAMESIGMWQ